MTLKELSVRSVRSSGSCAALILAFNFVQTAILARLLRPSDFGLMGMVNVVIGFACLFADAGIGSAIIRRQDVTKESLSSLYWLNVFISLLLVCMIWMLTPSIVVFYHEPRLYPLIIWASLLFLIIALGQQYQVFMEKALEFSRLAKIEITGAAVGLLVAIYLAWHQSGALALVGSVLASNGTKTLILIILGFKRWQPLFRFRLTDLNGYITFGLNYIGQRSVNYLSANIDYLFIGSFLGAQSLGYYTLAYNLANLPSTKINAVVSRVFFPVLSRLQNDVGKLKSGYLRMQEFTSMVNIPILFGIAVVAPIAIPLFFGSAWEPSIALLQILVIVGLARSIAGTIGPLLLARGRTDLGFRWSLLIASIQIPGIYLGVRSGTAVGVAVVFATLQCFYLFLNYSILIRTLLGPCLRDYVSKIWPSFWMSMIMAFTTLIISAFSSSLPPQYLLAVMVLTGAILYSVLAWYGNKPLVKELTQFVINQRNM
jgi:lipopolysaccharide exporter